MKLLEKMNDLEVLQDNPWKNDALDRDKSAEILTKLIRTLDQPFVISINSPWGTGKTTFVRMWTQHLLNEGQPCILFNAWENDFSDNPLVTFIGEINQFIDSYFPDDDAVEKIYKQMKSKAGQFFKKVTPLAIKMATRGAISNNEDLKDLFDFDSSSKEEVTKFLSDLIEDEIRDYDSKKKSITGFKASLAEFADTILSKNGSTPPLIIFIDELDRCRPNFALELLENIKHIFDVEKIVFILTVDKNQLKTSIRSLYGKEMQAEGYLRRFIDLEFQLEAPNYQKYIGFLCRNIKYNDYPVFHNTDFSSSDFQFCLNFTASSFDLSLRDLCQCFTLLNVILRTNELEEPHILVFLIGIKFYDGVIYEKIIGKEINPDSVLELFNINFLVKTNASKSKQRNFEYFEYALYAYLSSKVKFDEFLNKHKEIMDSEPDLKSKSKYFIELADWRKKEFYESVLFPELIEIIEMSGRFSLPE